MNQYRSTKKFYFKIETYSTEKSSRFQQIYFSTKNGVEKMEKLTIFIGPKSKKGNPTSASEKPLVPANPNVQAPDVSMVQGTVQDQVHLIDAALSAEESGDAEFSDMLDSDLTLDDDDPVQESGSLLDQATTEAIEAITEETIAKIITDLPPIYNVAAGMDVHRKQITVTVLGNVNGVNTLETRVFGTLKKQVRHLVAWLKECEVETAVMESTGIYWREPYHMLADAGIPIILANARLVKGISGDKTDKKDSIWLAKLARAGLIRKSRVVPRVTEEVRELARSRQKLVQMVTGLKNRIHKLLINAGFQVSQIATDIFGKSGLIIIGGLLNGDAPETILQNIERAIGYRLKTPRDVAVDALEGKLSDNVRFLIESDLETTRYLRKQIELHEKRLQDELVGMGMEPMIEILQTIPGISIVGAMIILVELGLDVSDFESAKKLSSWAGMCPGNNESAGKRKSCKTTHGNIYLKRILCEVAWAAAKTKCYFKEKYTNLRIRRGFKRAIVAIGNHILKVIYHMMISGETYRDRSVDYELMVAEKNAPRWTKMLKKLANAKEIKKVAMNTVAQ
jgi:transposase